MKKTTNRRVHLFVRNGYVAMMTMMIIIINDDYDDDDDDNDGTYEV